MRTIIALALVLAASVANAAPIYLSCDGKTTSVMQGQRDRVFKEVRTLTIDLSAKTVTFEGYGSTPIDMMDEENVSFAAKDPSRLRRECCVAT
jgi:hypothetical protein